MTQREVRLSVRCFRLFDFCRCPMAAILLLIAATWQIQTQRATAAAPEPSDAEPETNVERESPRQVYRLPVPALGNPPSLEPLLTVASASYDRIRSDVDDYTCILIRRERVDGRLRPEEFIYAKVRHRRTRDDRTLIPFSVYLKFLKPTSVRGREVLYVEGENNGELLARRGGTRFAFVTTQLDPFGEMAMRGNRYPITEFGFENLLYRLIETAREPLAQRMVVREIPHALVGQRPTTAIILTHPSRTEALTYYQARVFVDQELGIPIRFESYDWPKRDGGEPPVLEQYTYTQLKINVGLTDADFNADNPQYGVKREE